MNRLILTLAIIAGAAHSQTYVYLRSGPPMPQYVCGVSNTTPVVVTTCSPHLISPSCTVTGSESTPGVCFGNPTDIQTGTGISTSNGIRELVVTGPSTLALYDLSGSAIAGNGAWVTGGLPGGIGPLGNPNNAGLVGRQWVSQVTQYTIASNCGPSGYLGCVNSELMRKLALNTGNGMASTSGLVVSGCTGSPAANCVVTVATTYNPATFGKVPVAVTTGTVSSGNFQFFSITGTGTVLDTCGSGGGAQSPYSIASVTSSSWSSTPFTCSGLTNGDYTHVNDHCGPTTPTPNDMVGGTLPCPTVTQMAWTGNSWWDNMVAQMAYVHLTAYPDYLTQVDGGLVQVQNGLIANAGMAAIRFLVDPTPATGQFWLTEITWYIDHDYRQSLTGYATDTASQSVQANTDYNYTEDQDGLNLIFSVLVHSAPTSYWTPADKASFLCRMYNDTDDPSYSGPCYAGGSASTVNQDAANTSNHNWVLSSGLLSFGTNDATHATIPNTDPHYTSVTYTLTAAGTASGGNTVYTGAITGGGASAYVGQYYNVSGFTNAGNNGNSLLCVASTATTLTLVNAGGTAEIGAGSAFYAYYINTVVNLDLNNSCCSPDSTSNSAYGTVATQSTSGVLTVAGWFQAAGAGSGPPNLSTVVSATYTGGLTGCTGTTGQQLFIGLKSAPLVLSGASNASGGNTAYTGTITGGGSNAYAGFPITMAGFSNGANNGGFTVVSSTTTSITVNNASGVAESHAGTVSSPNTSAIVTVALSGTNTLGTTAVLISSGYWFFNAPVIGSIYGGGGPVTGCSGTPGMTAAIGTAYTIYDTATISSTTPGATATVTFNKTASLSGAINVGDGVLTGNGWSGFSVGAAGSLVTAVGSPSANQLTVVNSYAISTSTTIPRIAYRIPQWVAGDVGKLWNTKHTIGLGVQSAVYGAGGGAFGGQDNLLNGGGSSAETWPAFELATAQDDARAIRDLGRLQGVVFDWGIRPALDFFTGRVFDGPGYGADTDSPTATVLMWALTQAVASYPTFNVGTGYWLQGVPVWWQFCTLPDHQGGDSYQCGWAGNGSGNSGYQNYDMFGLFQLGTAFAATSWFSPLSNAAGYFRNFEENLSPGSGWGTAGESDRQARAFLFNDPRIPSVNYKAQPSQFFFVKSESANITAYSGWPHYYTGDAVISRTKNWNSTSDTVVQYDSATFPSSRFYDSPRAGELAIWKRGALLGCDHNPSNDAGGNPQDTCDTFMFNNDSASDGYMSGNYPNQVGDTPIIQYSFETSGTFGNQYGDANSNFAGACANTAPNFNQANLGISISYGVQCFGHQKYTGHDEFVWDLKTYALTTGTAIMNWHLQYPQMGATQSGGPGYLTGTTACPSLSGSTCVAGVIEELETGSGGMNYGLMTAAMSPNTITVNDDGTSYPGAYGYSHRFTVACGSSITATVSSCTTVTVHKVMTSLTDTAFTPTLLSPDTNWAGGCAVGTSTTGCYLAGLKGVTHSVITPFSVGYSGTADWIIQDLAGGIYNVSIGGVAVSGSPFTVVTGDNSLEFSTTNTGTVSISAAGLSSGSFLYGAASVRGGIIH